MWRESSFDRHEAHWVQKGRIHSKDKMHTVHLRAITGPMEQSISSFRRVPSQAALLNLRCVLMSARLVPKRKKSGTPG